MDLTQLFTKKVKTKDFTKIPKSKRTCFISDNNSSIALIPKIKWVEEYLLENFDVKKSKTIKLEFTKNEIFNTNTEILKEIYSIFGFKKDIDLKISDKGLIQIESDELIVIKTPHMR